MDKVSFIIIGRNQERTIYDCINSVYASVRENNLTCFEVIFVDSDSTDKTLEIIKEHFPEVILVGLKGNMSIAIAKNTGARIATGSVLFFIDGDITLDEKFIGQVLDEKKCLKYQLVSGKLEEILYNERWENVGFVKDRFGARTQSVELGGVFVIKTELFNLVSGFNEHMRVDEDADLQVRLAARNVTVERLPCRMATHNTVYYFSSKRLFKRLLKGDLLYLGAFYRQHIFDMTCISKFFAMQKFTIIFVISILLSIFANPFIILMYPVFILVKYLLSGTRKCSLPEYFLGRLLTDICLILGFTAFYPNLKKTSYEVTKFN
jgi:glycosyltransferase involved in cell wall biosynthesis